MTKGNIIVTDQASLVQVRIARILRARRAAASLSLHDLAARSGLSKGTLVNLERGGGNPSVAVLCQVASALGISLADLIGSPADASQPAQFALKAGKLVWRGPKGGSGTLLIGTAGPGMIELWEWILQPGERYDAAAHSKGTRELLLPSRGRLGVSAAAWKGVVAPAQGVLLATDVAHAYWCEGAKAARFRMFVCEPPAATRESPAGSRSPQ